MTDRLYNKYDILLFLLIASVAFGGFGGALAVPRFFTILFSIFLPVCFRRPEILSLKRYIVFLVFFSLYSVVSLIWSINKSEGVVDCIYNIIHSLFFIEICAFALYARRPLLTISTSWLIAFLATAGVAVYEITTGYHLPLSRFEEDIQMNAGGGLVVLRRFAAVTFGNFNNYVTYICLCLPFLVYTLLENKSLKCRWFFPLVAIFLSVFILIMNASRGGIISLAIVLSVLLLFVRKTKYTVFFGTIVIALLFCFLYKYRDILFLSISVRMDVGSEGIMEGGGRSKIWKDAFTVFLNSFGLGCGAGALSDSMELYGTEDIIVPHNFFLEILANYGILIFIPVISFLLRRFIRIIKTKNVDRSRRIILIAAFLSMPVFLVINSGYLELPHIYAFFASIVVFSSYRLFPSTQDYSDELSSRSH